MTRPRPPTPPPKPEGNLPPKPEPRPRPLPRVRLAYINPEHSRLAPDLGRRPRLEVDGIVRSMKKYGIPITRENYLEYGYGGWAKEWSAELEPDLPEQYQDWPRFEPKRKSRRPGK
jgi:hypothetical protein